MYVCMYEVPYAHQHTGTWNRLGLFGMRAWNIVDFRTKRQDLVYF